MNLSLKANDTNVTFSDALTLNAVAVNLTGSTVKFILSSAPLQVDFEAPAEIVNVLTGTVKYTPGAGFPTAPGEYRQEWEVTTSDDKTLTFPGDGWNTVTLIADLNPPAPPSVVSNLSDFYDPVRAILGDYKRVRYEDGAIASVLRTVLRMGRVPGYQLTVDTRAVSPAIGNGEVRAFALLVYHTAKFILLPNVAAYSYRTRAMSESFGNQEHFLFDLEEAIYELEFGEMFVSFQSYYSWVNSISGVDVWSLMTEMKVQAPVATVTLNSAGMQVNTK